MTLHKWFPAAAAVASSRAAKPTLLSASLQCPSQLARTLDWHTHKHQYGAEEAKSGGGGGSVVRPGRRRRPQHAQLPHFGTTGSPTHTNPESCATATAMRRRTRTPVIVSLSIGRTHLDVTLATHPSRMEPVQVLPSIALQHPTRHTDHDNSIARLQRQPLWSPSTIQAQLFDSLAKYLVDDHDPSDASAAAAAAAAGPISSGSRQRMLVTPVVVAAVLVAWPIQRDTGRCGAACGRVLHYLDHFLYRNGGGGDTSDRRWDFHRGAVVTNESRPLSLAPIVHGLHNIPLCLYKSVHPDDLLLLPHEDEWGRCAALARLPPSTVTQHVASRDQYWTSNERSSNSDDDDDDSMSLATRQWLEFGRTHWPQWPILLEPTQQPLPPGSAVAAASTRALPPRPVVSNDNDGPDDGVRPQRSLSSLSRRPTLLSECRRSPPQSRGGGVGPVWAMA
jgi:hypothetical protein